MTLFDMPFRHFLFWAGRIPPPGRDITWTDIDGIDVYKEMYKLVVWLLKRLVDVAVSCLVQLVNGRSWRGGEETALTAAVLDVIHIRTEVCELLVWLLIRR